MNKRYMILFVGIDNGLSGGIVVINEKQEVIQTHVMPVIKSESTTFDIVAISKIFDNLKQLGYPIFVTLEKAHVRPIQGIRSAFTTGYCFGMFQGLLSAYGISYEVANPSIWMKKVFEGNNTTDKKASIQWVLKKWPQGKWKQSERSTKYHDGLTDAAAIAYYGYLKNTMVT